MVGNDGEDLTAGEASLSGRSREFFKMSGSGNDFVVVDARSEPPGELALPAVVRAICARGTGVGADGIVFLERSDAADFRMTYLNSDGSKAALCGNASLCVAALAARLGLGAPSGMAFETGSGTVHARISAGHPEIDLQPPVDTRPSVPVPREPGEERIGFANTGVPHFVVHCRDVEQVDVLRRGAELRRAPEAGSAGANVNFISPEPGGGGWLIRTFERGVEGETLACGTGAVAAAVMLMKWGQGGSEVRLRTRSGLLLTVRLRTSGATLAPSLAGEGRVVFVGRLQEI